jgi:hypothetical protein
MLRIVCRHSAAEARADVNQGVVRSLIMPNGFLCYRNHALMTGAVSLPAALACALY